MKKYSLAIVLFVLLFSVTLCVSSQEDPPVKRLLAVGMSAGWQHDSVTDALVTMYELGRDSGLWETYIRTDVELITDRELEMNAKNLGDFDAVFFMTTGELPMDAEQKEALLSFVRDDGKGFLGAHNATDTFYEWPEFGEMIGGYFDGHPWNQFEAEIEVVDRDFPATRHFSPRFTIHDEIYQIRDFVPSEVRLLMRLDTESVDMTKEGVKHASVPITWSKSYGEGRVFYCGLGHRTEVWRNPQVREMWTEAVKWAMRIP